MRKARRPLVVMSEGQVVRKVKLQSVALRVAREVADAKPGTDVNIYAVEQVGPFAVPASFGVVRSDGTHREVRWF